MRICGLMAVGAVVTHIAAAGLGDAERVLPAATTASEPVREPAEGQKTEVGAQETSSQAAHETGAQAPLPASVITIDRDVRLAEKGMHAGSAVMIRIFKAESQLELWLQKDGRFELFATYPVCRWSGTLGPKLHEGDKQAPEGIYSVALPQIHRKGRWPRSLNIGYPNAFDRAMERTGSLILVHGGCTSTGCYAMTNTVMEEIYKLSEQALHKGQERIPVHVFPFRMTETNLAAHADSPWQPFWRNIKDAYDAFERTRVPPAVSVCAKKYVVSEGGQMQPAAVGAERTDCVDDRADAGAQAMPPSEDRAEVAKTRKVESKTQRRRSAGRNTRKAYAEARKARVAAHAARAKHASASKRSR